VKGKASVSVALGYTWGRPVFYYYNGPFGSNNQQRTIDHTFEVWYVLFFHLVCWQATHGVAKFLSRTI